MPDHPIILFDGVCNLCSGSVKFVIERDPEGIFRFAPLQSEAGREISRKRGLPEDGFSTFVLVEGGGVYTRSTAALRVLRRLGGLWRLLYGLIIIPPVLRDALYDYIARNRYEWFGKKDECMVAGPDVRKRFLE